MDRLFRIDFYPQDWLIDTARMSVEERGVYIQILMLIYSNRGPIENDAKWISNICGCSPRLARSLVDRLLETGFVQLSGGKITQKRAEHELNKKRTHLELSSKGGRTQREIVSKDKENKHLTRSDHQISVPSSSPIAIAKAKEIEETLSLSSPDQLEKPPVLLSSKEENYPTSFLTFYGLFPTQRKDTKAKTFVAWKKAIQKINPEELNEVTKTYAQSREVADGYAKGSVAWLNGEKWIINYKQTERKNNAQNSRHQRLNELLGLEDLNGYPIEDETDKTISGSVLPNPQRLRQIT